MPRVTLAEAGAHRSTTPTLWTPIYYGAATPLTWLAARVGVRPNAVTLGSLALFLACAAWAVLAPFGAGLLVGVYLGFNLAHVLDCVDGQLAAVLGVRSEAGRWLDHAGDAIKHAALGFALAALMMKSGGASFARPGLVALSVSIVSVASVYNYLLLMLSREVQGHTGPVAPPVADDSTLPWVRHRKLLTTWVTATGNLFLLVLAFLLDPETARRLVVGYCTLVLLAGTGRVATVFAVLRRTGKGNPREADPVSPPVEPLTMATDGENR